MAEEAPDTVSLATLRTLREALIGRVGARGYRADVGRSAQSLADLFRLPQGVEAWSPATRTGWRGPYSHVVTRPYAADPERGWTSVYGAPDDPLPLDGWGNPMVLQLPDPDADGVPDVMDHAYTRLVCAGADGVLSTPLTDAEADEPGTAHLPTRSQCGDDIVLYLHAVDERPP